MNRFLIIAAATVALSACSVIYEQPNYDTPFYGKYLNTGSELDGRINETLNALRGNPDSPALHNQLGALLVQKGFPKDAEREFERALNLDRRFYPAWYNLGLVRAARGDELGARRAFRNTIDNKPGHGQALFQLGLIEEKRQNIDRAVKLYAKAFSINPALMRVSANPRIVDTRLIHRALLEMYPNEQDRRSMQFLGTPAGWRERERQDPPAPSPETTPEKIVTPAPPATEPAQQPPVPPPGQ